ncbi:MAG: YkgJ family cysteine cluster protein [Candidatus Poseidoniales archaeon]|nr:YkgJ family cysteine cluster protein [Candidatus Poseidoniales archaeon]
MTRPWWMDGVPFQCQPDCGKCCDEPGGIVYLRPDDARIMASHHQMGVQEWLDRDCRQTIDGRWILKSDPITDICIYLDENKKCTVYQARPAQCKSFPFWAENVRSERSWKRTVSECPGLDSEDAIIIDGNTIRMKIIDDRDAMRGFREWPVKSR